MPRICRSPARLAALIYDLFIQDVSERDTFNVRFTLIGDVFNIYIFDD